MAKNTEAQEDHGTMEVELGEGLKSSLKDEADAFSARAEELMTDDMQEALQAAAGITLFLASLQESPEELHEFLAGCLSAVYNDGRNKAGKEDATDFDASDDVDALMMSAVMFGTSPQDAIYGAMGAVYVKGYDS